LYALAEADWRPPDSAGSELRSEGLLLVAGWGRIPNSVCQDGHGGYALKERGLYRMKGGTWGIQGTGEVAMFTPEKRPAMEGDSRCSSPLLSDILALVLGTLLVDESDLSDVYDCLYKIRLI
jgi:hypothetical protein